VFDTSSLPPLREVIERHDLRAHKALGQNFLLDQNLTDKIVRLSGGDLEGLNVIEVGPGPGGLTRSLLASKAASVTAVEFDDRAVRALSDLQEAAGGRFSLIHGDALKTDLMQACPAPRAIIANLPYNIATPLLTGWLGQVYEDVQAYEFMALMFQKEVAQRIAAKPGTKAYGRLGILCQWLCDCRLLFDVPASAFVPPPKVTSSIVLLKPRMRAAEDAPQPDFKALEAVTAAAFGQRRKMIRSSLKVYAGAIEACGIDPTLRAEDLGVEEYVRLASCVNAS